MKWWPFGRTVESEPVPVEPGPIVPAPIPYREPAPVPETRFCRITRIGTQEWHSVCGAGQSGKPPRARVIVSSGHWV